ncbi:MAG TPA: hypothetical protein VJM10_00060 [Candidatus Methylomirabilis sp.]|nr:hypothetical protein [Candidatus Methylomirabilis sp.]
MKPWGVTGIALILLTGIARAETGPRHEFFDARSNGLGYVIVQYGRIDLYDAKSNWIGYGRIEGSRVDRFDPKAHRLGQGTSGPGGMVNFYDLQSNWIGYGKLGLGGQTLELFDPRSTRMGTNKLR